MVRGDVIAICRGKRFYPLRYKRLKNEESADQIVAHFIAEMHRRNAMRNLKFFSELRQILKALSDVGVLSDKLL